MHLLPRRDLETWCGAVENSRKQLGKRTDHGACWARPQLEQEADRVRADLTKADARFAEIEAAYAAYKAVAVECDERAVALDAPDDAQLAYVAARRAAAASWAAFVAVAEGWAMPSVGQSALRRGYFKSRSGESDTSRIAKKADDLANYVARRA